MQSFLEKKYKTIIVLVLGFMLAVSVLNAWWDGAIFDEKAHIPAGYSYLTKHDMRLNPEHPPLIKDAAALPLVFMNLKFDTTKDFWTKEINGQWTAGDDLLWQEGNDADWVIFWSRLPIVLLSILLGLFIFKWAKELSGVTAGLFALAIYAFDPNILGHNHYVTTDLGIAAFMTFSFYYWFKFIKDPTWKNVALAGIFLGLVQLAKFSSIMLFPVFGLALIVYPLTQIGRTLSERGLAFKLKNLLKYAGKGAVAFAISIVVVWIVYFANTFDMPKDNLAQTINYYFAPDDISRNAVLTNHVLTALNDNAVTRPLSEYILGVAMVFKRVSGGNGAYFMGQVSGKAFPAYFPTVFALKEPLSNLFLMLLATLMAILAALISMKNYLSLSIKDKISSSTDYVKNNIVSLSMLAFVILYAYISITGNLNIGFRHLFPILPFVYILVSKVIFDHINKVETKQSKIIWGSSMILLVVFLFSEALVSYPNYMSYFNQLTGGPKNGYHYVTDSNADWGQDAKRLKVFLDKHPEISPIRVNYFGASNIKYYLGDKYIEWWDSKRPVEPGWYAISTNYLQGSIYDKEKTDEQSYRWIKDIRPIYQVGTSILVYQIKDSDIKNIK